MVRTVTFASQKRRGGGVRREVVSSKEGSRKKKRREVVRSREERSGVVESVNNPVGVGLLEGQGWRMK